jgi:glycerol-3-phosphate acyltransferase PlsX
MVIALDVLGGDFAPEAALAGAKLFLDQQPAEVTLLLIGPEEVILQGLGIYAQRENVKIHHAPDQIGMGEHPTKAFREKPQSTIAQGFSLLKQKAADVFCSAGNTGAMLVGSMFTIHAVEGIIRPAIASFVPREAGGYGIILDVGANADTKADVLVQFGEMGSLYAEHVMGISNPRVALMNMGEEEQKGTLLTQSAHQLFKVNERVNFIGNIEGRDVFNDKCDVIVCDGFVGNVILKQAESFYDLVKKRGFGDEFFERFNYEQIGGSPILGINANVVIGHGVSSPEAIKNMLNTSMHMADSHFSDILKKAYNE